MTATRLSPLDAAWLFTESRATPNHVGGLLQFRLPQDAPRDYLRQLMAEFRTHRDSGCAGEFLESAHGDEQQSDRARRSVAGPDGSRAQNHVGDCSIDHELRRLPRDEHGSTTCRWCVGRAQEYGPHGIGGNGLDVVTDQWHNHY